MENKKKKILICNGPNINLTGYREPEIYGHDTYLDLVNYLKKYGKDNNIKVIIKQTNSEGKIVDYLHEALLKNYYGVVLNAGAYTHYSYAIRDAITSICLPVIEVHLSDTKNRDDFRKISVITDVCQKTFQGKHFESYKEALDFLIKD